LQQQGHNAAWFQITAFRQAVSMAINRADLARVIFNGYATPAYGPASPSNHFWFNRSLAAPTHDPQRALQILSRSGFRFDGGSLKDSSGHAVEFTVVTNSGNVAREKMAALIQQDLSQIGISVKVVTLDFPSLIERVTRTFDYDACILGLVNTDLDPNGQLTVWLSSGENHQWNPNQKSPATPWEAEIDSLMREQASNPSEKIRKAKFDRVQEIVAEQQPFIYLVNKNALSAISSDVIGASPAVLSPQAFWNIDSLRLKPSQVMGANK
jgi:peptide/nickel transport system substrate-binding protein